MGRHVAAGLTAGVTTGIAAWLAMPFVSMSRRGTIDSRARSGWSAEVAPVRPLAPRVAIRPAIRPAVRPAVRPAAASAPLVVPAPRPAPELTLTEDARIVRARRRAAMVATIPGPRMPHPSEFGPATDGPCPDVVIPAARRSPRTAGGPADWLV